MVFITDGIDEQMLRDSLEKFADEAVSENSDRTMERIG
jgi:hypothetical protein